jgi:hypothetical protein
MTFTRPGFKVIKYLFEQESAPNPVIYRSPEEMKLRVALKV